MADKSTDISSQEEVFRHQTLRHSLRQTPTQNAEAEMAIATDPQPTEAKETHNQLVEKTAANVLKRKTTFRNPQQRPKITTPT